MAVGDTGGSVELSVAVTDATSCTFSANRSVSGLPATVPCTNGTVLQNVTVPANTKSKAAVYKFKIAVAGSTLKPQKVTVTVVGKQKCSQRTSRSDLAGCDLTGVTLGNLPDSDLAGANLTDANLTDSHLQGATLTGATLTGATMSSFTQLSRVTSGGIIGVPSGLPTGSSLVDGYLVGPAIVLAGADLAGADLTGTNLSNTDLIDAANLSGADLSGVDMQGADLGGADLSGATLTGADLGGADLSTADLNSADLTDGELSATDLAGADLTDATLTGVSSGSITGTPSVLPADWSLTVGYLVGPGAYLNDANLMDADLSGVDLSGAVLTDVASGGITGTPSALPTDWSLTDGYLIGPDADLYYADLSTPTCPAPISRAPSCTVPT